jgi:hypothetical protein
LPTLVLKQFIHIVTNIRMTMPRTFYISLMLLFIPFSSFSQTQSPTLSGLVKDAATKGVLPFVNVTLKFARDSSFVLGTITNDEGRFTITDVKSGNYFIEVSFVGYGVKTLPVLVGTLSAFLDLGTLELAQNSKSLERVTITSTGESGVSDRMDKKTFSLANNVSQAGGSVLQAMNNLPGITTSQEGKLQLRGSGKVAVLIDGKQTALTGFDSQTGLDNIPASAIERIEIINNPSAKYELMVMRVSSILSLRKTGRKASTEKQVSPRGLVLCGKRSKTFQASGRSTRPRQKSILHFHLITGRIRLMPFCNPTGFTQKH